MNYRNYARTLFSNQAIIEHHNIRWWFGILLFVVSMFLATIPFYVSSFRPVDYEFYFPGITNAVYSFMEESTCEISENKLSCQESSIDRKYGDIRVRYMSQSIEEITAQVDTIYFLPASFYYVNQSDNVIEGTYETLGEFAFQDIIQNNKQQKTSKEELVNVVLKNIELSSVSLNMSTITVSMFLQYSLFTVLIAYLYRFAKGRSLRWNFTYGDSLKMIVLSMISPALLSAFGSLFMTSVATLIFPFAYVVRVVFLYMRLARYGVKTKIDE